MHRRVAPIWMLIRMVVAVWCNVVWCDACPADTLATPPAIETAEVVPVPQQLQQQLHQYQNTRAAAFQGWAPSGRGMLIATRFGNTVQLHRVYEPGGRREQVTFFEEPTMGGFREGVTRDEIVASLSRGGDENFQLYWLAGAGRQPELLTDGKSRNRRSATRRDGSQFILESNRRNGRDTDLYRFDFDKPSSPELLMEVTHEHWSVPDWSADGRTLLLHRYVSVNESYLALFDLATRQRTDLKLPSDEKAAIGTSAFSADGHSIYLTTDAGSEFQRLARLDLATREYRWLSDNIPWDVDELSVDRTTGAVAFTANEDGASRLYLLQDDQPRAVETPLGIIARLEFSPDGKQLGFSFARPDAPSDAYSLRLDDRRLERWTYSEVGGLDPASFVVPQRIRYTTFDGRDIPAYYYRPRAAAANRPAAVLIQIHGGPEGQFQPFFSSALQFYVNELGVAVLCPNVRGSKGYGKTYLQLDNGDRREDSVKDIGSLLDWIEKQPELDASRVAVTGASYGGYMVLASLVHFGERVRAGIDIVGIANFQTFLERTAAYRQDLRRAEYGDERDPKMQEFFARMNPVANADRIRSALLVVHGKNDPRVPFSEAQQIAAKVRAQGRPVWTVFAADEGHGFSKKANADYLRGVEAWFLMQHLLEKK